jgi:4-hydroxy-tetrahydrodipicolinate synthase
MPFDKHQKPDLRDVLQGVLPPVTMPFDAEGRLVRDAMREQIDLIVDAGANGVVAGGSTGEGHTLSDTEFIDAMNDAYEATAGRVPFLAGLIVNSTIQAIRRTRALEGMKLAALQVTPVHYLFKPDDRATIEHFRTIWEETGVPIIIYNVIPWNYLSVDLMLRIMDEVPGVIGMKQSSGDLKSLSDLLLNHKAPNIVLSGIDALLYPGFALGMHGAISALTSAVPGPVVKLRRMVHEGRHDEARALHFHLNRLWNTLPHEILPGCVKYIQHLQGLPLYHPRAPMVGPDEGLRARIAQVLAPVLAA